MAYVDIQGAQTRFRIREDGMAGYSYKELSIIWFVNLRLGNFHAHVDTSLTI